MLTTARMACGVLLIAAMSAMGAVHANAEEAPAMASVEMESARMAEVYRATVKALRSDLKDAPSARFREVYVRTTVGQDGQFQHGICGYSNAKNSYGGYTGWQRFFGSTSMLVFEGERHSLDAIAICDNGQGRMWTDSDFAMQMTRDVTAP